MKKDGLMCVFALVMMYVGSNHALLPLCVYSFESPSNLCANAKNIVTFAWNIKIFFAILTDVYRPFGMRRRPWMIAGWVGVLVFLLILAIAADKISASAWLGMLLVVNAFVMLSDVPADGYSVELGQLEDDSQRGQILATGQRVRFTFCIIAGVIQTLLLNGPSTNDPDCQTSFAHCWSWGLSINGYYGLLFSMVFVLTIPVWWLKELDSSAVPLHSLKEFFSEIWITLQNLTTFYLVIFVIFIQGFCNFTSNANITLQYYLIKLTNFQAGIDTVTTYMALVAAIWIFQRYMIRWNWRYSEYLSVCSAAGLGLLWILAYYDVGGLMNPWFTIFIDLDTVSSLVC